MELSRKEYLSFIKNIEELEQVVFRYKNNSKPVLICIASKKLQNVLISDLKNIYEKSYVKEELRFVVVKNKNDYFCKVRYKDCGISKVISSQCRYCKEKDSCRYMIEKKMLRDKKHKYEIVDTKQFVNKLLGNLKFHENYSKVVLYKGSADSLFIKISKVEVDELVSNLRPKKLNTNEKIKISKLCNKCEKLTFIFFNTLDNKAKVIQNKNNLIRELGKLEVYESYKVGYVLNKLRLFDSSAVVSIKENNENKIITFKLEF